MRRLLCTIIFLGLGATSAYADSPDLTHFAAWLSDLEQEAIESGISSATVHEALDHALLDDRVVTLDQKQPEVTVTFDAYSQRVVSDDRVEAGHEQLEKNGDILNEVSSHYGVQPQIIVALWGVESSFGHNKGTYSVIDSLTTLAFEGRRAEFFRKELLNALRILDEEHIPAAALRGSWAGAMGQCQFMPSTYLRYAVDADGDGLRNIWTDNRDVFASIANYLSSEGWRGDQNWGQEVLATAALDEDVLGLDHTAQISEWQQRGIEGLNGGALPISSLKASLIQPDGPNGRSFLIYDNFRALMRWNKSTYFATSVGLLADRIK